MLDNSRLGTTGALTLVCVALFGVFSGTFASFAGQTSNRGSSFSMTSLYAPSSLTVTASPRSVALGWQAGMNGNGYRVLTAPAPNPTSSACGGATFSSLATVSGVTHNDARSTPQGTYQCYKVETNYGVWTSVDNNPVASARLGFVITATQLVNGGTGGQLDAGDRLVVTFNHPVTISTGPLATIQSVCAVTGSTIVVGSGTLAGGCAATEGASLGRLTGGTSDRSGRFTISAVAWDATNTVATITLGARTAGGNPRLSGSWTMAPTTDATKLLSANGAHHVCDTNAGGGNCMPVAAGSF